MKDDTVMAEYVTVMMANRKGPDMIAEELRELIGGELDASITQKIWKCACDVLSPPKTHAQERARSASPPPPPQPESTEQRTKITSVIRSQRVEPVTNVNFNISVGTRVPRDVHFYPLPAEVVTIYPEWRGYDYILVREQIIVLDPRTHEIVAVLDT